MYLLVKLVMVQFSTITGNEDTSGVSALFKQIIGEMHHPETSTSTEKSTLVAL
jgi:hypothetical protein